MTDIYFSIDYVQFKGDKKQILYLFSYIFFIHPIEDLKIQQDRNEKPITKIRFEGKR